jgi:hypothetical protein
MFKMLLLTPDMKSRLEGVAMKISKPGFECKLRVIYLSPRAIINRGRTIATIKGSLAQYNSLNSNGFAGVGRIMTKEDWFWEKWFVEGKKNRVWNAFRKRNSWAGAGRYILNIEELATIWHFPIITVKAPLVSKTESRRGEPPNRLPQTTELPGQGSSVASPSAPQKSNTPNIPFV